MRVGFSFETTPVQLGLKQVFYMISVNSPPVPGTLPVASGEMNA